jgi:DNA polymerase III alpha subunit
MGGSGGKMQREAGKFAAMYLVLATIGCMDQSHQDQALAAMEAARRDAARDARLQTLEREHAFLMQQVAAVTASNQALLAQTAAKEEEQDKHLGDVSLQLGTMDRAITALRQDALAPSSDPNDDSNQARNAAIRKVQGLIDAGRVTITMRDGRIQLSPARLLETTRPYEPAPAKPTPPKPVVTLPKRPVDRLGF